MDGWVGGRYNILSPSYEANNKSLETPQLCTEMERIDIGKSSIQPLKKMCFSQTINVFLHSLTLYGQWNTNYTWKDHNNDG